MVMKKIALLLLLVAGLSKAGAQQALLGATPDVKLNDGLQNAFKPKTLLTSQQLLLQPMVSVNQSNFSNNGIAVYSTMPVVKVSSVDRMPILVPGENGVSYTMLIKKVTVINPNEPVAKPLIP
jgi:hypothetical protein